MKSRFLIPLALIAASVEPSASEIAELQAGGIEFLAHLTPTEFQAINPSSQTLQLYFVSSATGASATLYLPPLAEVNYQFPSGSVRPLTLQVTTMAGGKPISTTPVLLSTIEWTTVDALWVRRQDDCLHSFIQTGGTFTPIDPGSNGGTQCSSSGSLHVPEMSLLQLSGPELPQSLEAWVPPA